MSENKSLLIIGSVWPEPDSSAAGQRMMQLISVLQSEGWSITFASTADESDYCADLGTIDIEQKKIKINDSSFDRFVEELQPDIVIFDRFLIEEQFGWRVAESCPAALRILDTEDLHCLRRLRKKAVQTRQAFDPQDLLTDEVAKREIASIYRCDLSLVISEFEMDLLQDAFGVDESLIHYIPFLLDPIDSVAVEGWPVFEERKHFVTIGNFRHPPNLDAVKYLRSDIWPLIRKELPGAKIHLYGAYPSKKVWDLNNPEEGFCIKGRAEDAREVVRSARVSLAPLRFGAGLKGKLVESMLCGTPSVTTPIGAEGMSGELEWNGFIAEEAPEIASKAVRLYTDKEVWTHAQQQGIEIINSRFISEMFSSELIKRLEKLHANLSLHRRKNFIGSMLMHHTAAGTKYMSKWIEEKNR